jgi:transposase-like protein
MSTGKRYSDEFKEAAVAMVTEGRNPSAVSKDLGVCLQTLARWIRKSSRSRL